ncbi:hypothetical protein Plec18167_000528 [Paecilomyces lecythidis]|uniref:DUF1275 domain protein n=1 Tax=Paecilomyces lecythidis TaxID=3004212 RepID=A0ABR3YE69_9EURO
MAADAPQTQTATSQDIEANKGQLEKHQPSAIAQRFRETLDTNHADLVFIVCSLITGLSDGSAYNAWSCFISMQTGNTIFLGLGASGQPFTKPYGWLKSLVSIASFFCGAFTFSHATRWAGPRLRGTLFASFLIQCIFIMIAAGLIEGDLIPHTINDMSLTSGPLFLELIPLFILAFQFGGQMAASRAMGFNEIPTVVLTSVYFDIATDPALTAPPTRNVKRNRRIGSVTGILVGAIAAGWLSRSSGGMESALWIGGGLKFCIAMSWLFWKPVAEKK